MLKVKEIKSKSIITPSRLPGSDFVINPYTGCQHGCKYCYAKFMCRFSNHAEPWGQFVDVKINAADLIPASPKKYQNKTITISSVTDPYQALESKYLLTRKILEKLVPLQPELCIITKSKLVERDIDLLQQFENCTVAISLAFLDEAWQSKIEPYATSPNGRITVLKKLHAAGIYTVLFISPIFPMLTDWQTLIKTTKDFVDEYWFENLKIYYASRYTIYKTLNEIDCELAKTYRKIFSRYAVDKYWQEEAKQIADFCEDNDILCQICFNFTK